jgi:hypothetical protein
VTAAAKWRGLALALTVALSSARPAAARDGAADAPGAAAAEALYQDGRQLLLQGATELACARLQASQSVQPAVGTLLLLGHCYEALGRTASAWAVFHAAESLARSAQQSERAEIARVRAAALEARLSRLEILLPAGVDTRAWQVRQDERSLPLASLTTPLPLDPGEHELSVSAPGYEPWSTRLSIAPERALTQVRVPPLSVRSEPTQTKVPSPAAMQERAPHTFDWQRAVGYGATGLGAMGLGLGVGFALHAQQLYDQSLARCRTETLCSAAGVQRRERAESSARVASVAAVAGAALALGGITLWWTSRDAEAALQLGMLGQPSTLGLAAVGAF